MDLFGREKDSKESDIKMRKREKLNARLRKEQKPLNHLVGKTLRGFPNTEIVQAERSYIRHKEERESFSGDSPSSNSFKKTDTRRKMEEKSVKNPAETFKGFPKVDFSKSERTFIHHKDSTYNLKKGNKKKKIAKMLNLNNDDAVTGLSIIPRNSSPSGSFKLTPSCSSGFAFSNERYRGTQGSDKNCSSDSYRAKTFHERDNFRDRRRYCQIEEKMNDIFEPRDSLDEFQGSESVFSDYFEKNCTLERSRTRRPSKHSLGAPPPLSLPNEYEESTEYFEEVPIPLSLQTPPIPPPIIQAPDYVRDFRKYNEMEKMNDIFEPRDIRDEFQGPKPVFIESSDENCTPERSRTRLPLKHPQRAPPLFLSNEYEDPKEYFEENPIPSSLEPPPVPPPIIPPPVVLYMLLKQPNSSNMNEEPIRFLGEHFEKTHTNKSLQFSPSPTLSVLPPVPPPLARPRILHKHVDGGISLPRKYKRNLNRNSYDCAILNGSIILDDGEKTTTGEDKS